MPSSIFWGFQHLNSNVLCSLEVDLTGPDPDVHEIAEICVLPLDHMLRPHKELLLFNMRMKPEREVDYKYCRLSRSEIAALMLKGHDSMKVADLFSDWYQTLGIKERKRIIPIGYNLAWKLPIVKEWLGPTVYNDIFANDYRDVRVAAHFVNDRDDVRGEPVTYSKQDLRWLCKQHGIDMILHGGSCASDAMQIAELYAAMLKS